MIRCPRIRSFPQMGRKTLKVTRSLRKTVGIEKAKCLWASIYLKKYCFHILMELQNFYCPVLVEIQAAIMACFQKIESKDFDHLLVLGWLTKRDRKWMERGTRSKSLPLTRQLITGVGTKVSLTNDHKWLSSIKSSWSSMTTKGKSTWRTGILNFSKRLSLINRLQSNYLTANLFKGREYTRSLIKTNDTCLS